LSLYKIEDYDSNKNGTYKVDTEKRQCIYRFFLHTKSEIRNIEKKIIPQARTERPKFTTLSNTNIVSV